MRHKNGSRTVFPHGTGEQLRRTSAQAGPPSSTEVASSASVANAANEAPFSTRYSALERKRIQRRLRDAAKYPIIALVAPAGYGKSTAVRHFLRHRRNSILIGIPASAANLEDFIRAFGAGCADRFPSMATLPDLPIGPATESIDRIGLYVSWALANLGAAKCTIALDDLHHTDRDATIAMFLQRLAEASKGKVQWVFSSRTYGNLPHNRWQVYADADATITASDLRMSTAEALAICRALRSPASAEQVEAWVERTQGFPVFLTYAIRLSANRGTSNSILDGARAVTFSFLAEQLWSTLPQKQRLLLEIAALLPPTHPRAFEAAGINGAMADAKRLTAEISFLTLAQDGTFSMHDLFGSFIKEQLSDLTSTVLRDRYLAAAEILFAEGHFSVAFSMLIENCPLPDTLRAVERHALAVDDLSTKKTIATFVCEIPASEMGLAALTLQADYWSWVGDFHRSERYADELLARSNATSANISVAIRSIYRSINFQSHTEQRRIIETLPTIIDRLDSADRVQAEAYRAALLARLPDHVDDARNLIADVAGRLGQLERRARVDAEIAVASAQFYFGDIEAALHTNHDALATAKTLNDPRELARTTNNYGLLLYQVFDRRIEDLFDTHRETVEKTGAWRFAHVSHWLPAEYYVWQADVVKARASQALQRAAFSNEESEALRLRSLRRHTELLCNLIEGNFSPIVRDLQELGLPRDLDSAYAIIGPSAIASGLNSDTVGSAQLLQKAKAIRESLTPFQFGAVRSAVVIEIIALGVIGRWPEARRLFERIKGTAPNLASLDVALGLLCDGPPFVGVAEALGPCRGRPFMGLAALLIDRLLERAPVSEGAPRLTLAELEVLRLLGLGKPNKEIAAARSRSLDTVKRQVASIYHKLGVENRTAAVAVARTRGLL